ncbi:DUF922 domain-containing protein [Bowmanella sp. Y26]|uniref:DUF922 domain-containing Zn-dependent protease n=1 Tax=Bowmanella yangjiangensis TaxID=2811230 RepID=UPI001BDD8E59|nr:DUF922 domain-containing protein [Bowmanella yangjiangensis]MBT1062336.1 DUF922 domain-containing protein [Bowmanella yangjiangensis]
MKKCCSALLFLPLFCAADAKVIENYRYYNVSATEKGRLLDALNKASPIREDGETFHGHTKYHIGWQYWWDKREKHCALTKVEITLTLTYTMPKLASASDEVKQVWDAWYPNLALHEERHGKLAKDTAALMDQKLNAIGPRDNCRALEKDVNKQANALMAELKKANKHYDNQTNHGETEGAWLHLHL